MIGKLLFLFFMCFVFDSLGRDVENTFSVADSTAPSYRMYNHQQFTVIDSSCIWLYQYQSKIIDMVRVSAKSSKVVNKTVTDYYFSLNGQSELFQLTLSNVKLTLLFNQKLYQEFCQQFKTTESLLAKTDKGKYMLNYFLLEHSIKK